jgi:hypothetical protein
MSYNDTYERKIMKKTPEQMIAQIDSLIEDHVLTIDALKTKRSQYQVQLGIRWPKK